MFVIIYLSAKSRAHSTFDRFIDKMDIIIGIFLAIGVILTAKIFQTTLEQNSVETTLKIIDRGWISVNRELFKKYKYCPNFANSLYYDWQKDIFSDAQLHSNYSNEDDWYAVNYLSMLIFQTTEDFLTTSTFDETGHYVWFSNFLQWYKSPILQNMWAVQKSNYADTTKELVDLLIKLTQKYNIQNETELTRIGKQIEKSGEIKQIFLKKKEKEHLLGI